MQVKKIQTRRARADFDFGPNLKFNRVDILTGPNGSGKTEILSELALAVGLERGNSKVGFGTWRSPSDDGYPAHEPVRVITQTFSPFSRFPAPRATSAGVSRRYLDEIADDRYIAQGFHQGSRSARPARAVLEQALFGLSETIEVAPSLLRLLKDLGFREHFQLRYRESATQKLRFRQRRDNVLSALLDAAEEDLRLGRVSRPLQAELRRVGREQLEELIDEAVQVIENHAEFEGGAIAVNFGIHFSRSTFDYAVLQSMSLLRRLGLVSLLECSLFRTEGDRVDIASASSGQQQLLCSIFGLATALRHESLVLIDEPELSLHPQWQLAYMDHLAYLLSGFDGCHVLIATHSPLIVQQAQSLGASIVQLDHGGAKNLHFESHQSVESTLIDVFDTAVPGSQHLANELFLAVSRGESGSKEDRREAIRELDRLRLIYERSEVRDEDSLDLIAQAIDLLRTAPGALADE